MTRYQKDRVQFQCEWFTSWFRETLGKRKLTTDMIADMTGLHKSTIMDYMVGVRSPSLKTFLMLLDRLGFELQITEKSNCSYCESLKAESYRQVTGK